MTGAAEQDALIALAREALWTAASASLPILAPVLIIGLIVALIQAMTSINEATLTFVPKLIVTGAVLALFGSAILTVIADFARTVFAQVPVVIH